MVMPAISADLPLYSTPTPGYRPDQAILGAGMTGTVDRRASDPGAVAGVVGPLWSEPRVCEALAVTTDALAALRATGDVLGAMTSDGVALYPVSQFQRRDGVTEVRPGLVPFLRALHGFDCWAVAVLLDTPAPELDDRTPLDWLRAGGDPETVAALGTAVAREWGAGSARDVQGARVV